MRLLLAALVGLVCGSAGAATLVPAATFAPHVLVAAPLAVASPTVTKGTITTIDKDTKTFVVTTDKDEEVTISYDDKTVWVLDGQVSTSEAVLKEDYEVTITHASGAAARVEGKPMKP